MKRFLAKFAAVALGVTTSFGLSHACFAADPPGAKAYLEAADQFDQMAQASRDNNILPRRSDQAALPVLEKLSDAAALFGSGQYHKDDLPTLMTICQRSAVALSSYSTALLPKDRSNLSQAQVIAALQQSIQAYQDEASPLMAFSTACFAKMVTPLEEFVHSLKPEEFNDVRRQGLIQMRMGILQTVVGSLINLSDETMSSANRLMLIRAVADHAEILISALTPEQRQQILLTTLSAAKSASPDESALIDVIGRTAGSKECSGLCAL